MKHNILTVMALGAAILLAGQAGAANPGGYYNSLEGLSGVSLKKAVKNAAKSHTAISYGDGTWSVFIESDTRIVGSQRCWWDMYSNNNVAAPNSSSHSGLNIEHSVANSWWGGTKNDAYKDLMHLNPSNSDANSRKSNYPLGEIATETWSNGVTFVGKPKSGSCGGATYVYEPADEYKGDFARAFFYMFTIYDDIAWSSQWDWMYDKSSDLLLKPWAYEMLLEWSEKDPVSQKEIDRNEVIYKHQKNRNPFIDYPELAQHIWGSKKNTPFHLEGGADPGPTPDPDPDPTPEPDDPSPVPPGFWYAVTSTADLNASDLYVIVSTENNIVMSTATGGSGSVTYFRPCGKTAAIDRTTSRARISTVPDDAAVIRLEKSGASWTMEVADVNGVSKGYLASSETKKVSLSNNPTPALITPNSDNTAIRFGSVAGNLQYNNQENGRRFTTYTSTQEAIMLYRLEEDKGAGIGTGLEENADEEIIGIYDVNGRKVDTRDLSQLSRGIYIVISNFGTKKIIK